MLLLCLSHAGVSALSAPPGVVVLWVGHGRWITWCSDVFIGFNRLIWVPFGFWKFTCEMSKLKELMSTKIQTILSIYSVPGTCQGGREKRKASPRAVYSSSVCLASFTYVRYLSVSLVTVLGCSYLQVLSHCECLPFPQDTLFLFCLNLVILASPSKTTSSQNPYLPSYGQFNSTNPSGAFCQVQGPRWVAWGQELCLTSSL